MQINLRKRELFSKQSLCFCFAFSNPVPDCTTHNQQGFQNTSVLPGTDLSELLWNIPLYLLCNTWTKPDYHKNRPQQSEYIYRFIKKNKKAPMFVLVHVTVNEWLLTMQVQWQNCFLCSKQGRNWIHFCKNDSCFNAGLISIRATHTSCWKHYSEQDQILHELAAVTRSWVCFSFRDLLERCWLTSCKPLVLPVDDLYPCYHGGKVC